MKGCVRLLIGVRGRVPAVRVCTVLALGLAGTVQADWSVTNDLSAAENRVAGDGRARSSLTDGASFTNQLGIQGRGTLSEYRYSLNMSLKATDDERNDPERVTLGNLQGSLTGDRHALTAGDTFESFSQYTLGTAVKGLSYRYGSSDGAGTQLTLVGGYAYPRWHSFWDRDSAEQKVSGIRLKHDVLPELVVGASVVQQDDDERFATESLYQNLVGGVDWEYLPIQGLTIKGESAFNDTRESPLTGAGTTYSGQAHKMEAVGDGGPSRVKIEYERIDPDFVSNTGSATADREKAKAEWRYRPEKDTTWRFGFLWYHDNLDGQLANTTDHYRPEIQWIRRNFAGRQYAQLDLGYKFDNARGGAAVRDDHLVSAVYRDRLGEIDLDAELGSNFYETQATRDEQEVFGNITLTGRREAGVLVLKPSVRAGVWTQQDELADSRDRRTEYSVGLGLDLPAHRVTSTWRVGRNEQERDESKPVTGTTTVTDSARTFASVSVNYRPEGIAFLRDGMLYLRASMNDFTYTLPGRNYVEESIVAGIKVKL